MCKKNFLSYFQSVCSSYTELSLKSEISLSAGMPYRVELSLQNKKSLLDKKCHIIATSSVVVLSTDCKTANNSIQQSSFEAYVMIRKSSNNHIAIQHLNSREVKQPTIPSNNRVLRLMSFKESHPTIISPSNTWILKR